MDADVRKTLQKWAEEIKPITVTTTKPQDPPMRLMPSRIEGLEPVFSTTYVRKTRIKTNENNNS